MFKGLPDQWNALLKGSKITPEDAAKNPQTVLEALEFYTEQTRVEKPKKQHIQQQKQEWNNNDSLISSKSTPAPGYIRQPPARPTASKKVRPDQSNKQSAEVIHNLTNLYFNSFLFFLDS